jgi:hypothetical protein
MPFVFQYFQFKIGLNRFRLFFFILCDQYHIKTALEQNNSEAKQQNQITDQTRTDLNVEPEDRTHKRKDYTENLSQNGIFFYDKAIKQN